MLKLGVLSVLFAVLILAPATLALGPFHSAVDDYGQAYYAKAASPLAPIQLGPPQKYLSSQFLPAIEGASTLIFVASNSGRYTAPNPAMFILAEAQPSDPSLSPLVSDASWYCKGYGKSDGVSQEDWPKNANAERLIIDALTDKKYENWPKGVELSPNLSFIWGLTENIPLEANYLWARGLEPGSKENPPINTICIKSLP